MALPPAAPASPSVVGSFLQHCCWFTFLLLSASSLHSFPGDPAAAADEFQGPVPYHDPPDDTLPDSCVILLSPPDAMQSDDSRLTHCIAHAFRDGSPTIPTKHAFIIKCCLSFTTCESQGNHDCFIRLILPYLTKIAFQ